MAGGKLTWNDIEPVLQGLTERFDYIEKHLSHLGETVGYRYTPMNSSVPAEIKELVRAGKTLEALRCYREMTGAGLEQAKAAVMGL